MEKINKNFHMASKCHAFEIANGKFFQLKREILGVRFRDIKLMWERIE